MTRFRECLSVVLSAAIMLGAVAAVWVASGGWWPS